MLHQLGKISVQLVPSQQSFRPYLPFLFLVGEKADSIALGASVIPSEHEHRPGVFAEEARKV